MKLTKGWKRIILIILISVLITVGIFIYFNSIATKREYEDIDYDVVWTRIEQNKIKSVEIRGMEISGQTRDGKFFKSNGPSKISDDPEFYPKLRSKNVRITVHPERDYSKWFYLALIVIFLIGFVIMPLTVAGGMAGKFEGLLKTQQNFKDQFSSSNAKRFESTKDKVTFKHVAGIDVVKMELEEIIEMLRDPEKFKKLGGRVPKGVLLTGPPGCGKTLFARAMAGEADVPFFFISGSDFAEMLVGVGAARMRDLFEQGKENAPCILFIDEIDAVGRRRGTNIGGGHDREQTLNQLLVEMDGFEQDSGVIVVAATNRPDVLDPALLRPGRFDRRIEVPRPMIKGREEIFDIHINLNEVPLDDSVDIPELARATLGCVGADIENIINEAALFAGRKDKDSVDSLDFEEALQKVFLGLKRPDIVFSDEERRLFIIHESAHTLVGTLLKYDDPVRSVTIVPRGPSGGSTWQDKEERAIKTREHLIASIMTALAGRVAEKVVLKIQTSGSASDIQYANDIARIMVFELGMSELGPFVVTPGPQNSVLGHEMDSPQKISETTLHEFEQKSQEIILEAERKTEEIITRNIRLLKAYAAELDEHESIEHDRILEIAKEHGVDKPNSLRF